MSFMDNIKAMSIPFPNTMWIVKKVQAQYIYRERTSIRAKQLFSMQLHKGLK